MYVWFRSACEAAGETEAERRRVKEKRGEVHKDPPTATSICTRVNHDEFPSVHSLSQCSLQRSVAQGRKPVVIDRRPHPRLNRLAPVLLHFYNPGPAPVRGSKQHQVLVVEGLLYPTQKGRNLLPKPVVPLMGVGFTTANRTVSMV